MRLTLAMIGIGLMALGGCAGNGASAPRPLAHENDSEVRRAGAPDSASAVKDQPAADEQVVARINGRAVTLRQLQEPLFEAHGLNLLLNLAQLELARHQAEEADVEVTEADIQAEHDQTVARLFTEVQLQEDENVDELLNQFLAQQGISRTEFDLVLEINAHLRKIAEPMLEGRITEENLRTAYRTLYGETIQVRHIQCANMQEIAEVRRRLADGEAFEAVARDMSRNPQTAGQGGRLPVFSRAMTDLPEAFKETAFALEVGEVSDPVQAQGAYHLIKLEERFEPRAVAFEDVKDSVYQTLYDQWLQATIRDFRTRLGQQLMHSMEIEDPTLRRLFEEEIARQQAAAGAGGDGEPQEQTAIEHGLNFDE